VLIPVLLAHRPAVYDSQNSGRSANCSSIMKPNHLLLSSLLALALNASGAETVWLNSLDLSNMRQGYGAPQVNRSIREKPLAIGGKTFERGVGTHASSIVWIELGGGADRFLATVGVDDAAAGNASLEFRVLADGRKLFESGLMKPGMPAKSVDVGLKGARTLLLQVTDAGDGIAFDHADWAEARFEVSGPKPRTVRAPEEEQILLTPKPGPAPRVNGPKVYGCRPGNSFLYRIPAQGERPMVFSARGLPATLKLDSSAGIITGTAPARGTYQVTLQAKNSRGQSTRSFKIVSGDTLSLTPSMGWNHWYAHYDRVTDKMMREAADLMISKGMADVGYDYVNIDDCWMNAPKQSDPLRVGPLRDETGKLIPNKHFPDMKALTDYIHSKGLKAGTYISPGPLTCAGFAGSYQHEAQDAQTFAEWGFDFLKYDWCSYGHIAEGGDPKATNIPTWGKGAPTLEGYMYPYRLMGNLLKQQKRDILLNLCQYGMGEVWKWGASVGGQSWRTAGDLGFELDRIFEVALKNAEHREWSRPGSWNDPDYLQIGWIGNARGGGLPQPCPLTSNEQYAYMSLWALMASPLFYSGDMTKLDEFTLNVLCNAEVIDVNQDPLGQCAAVTTLSENTFVMVKDLEDGSKAVGLFNRGEFPAEVVVTWNAVGVSGKHTVRDLWRQQDIGVYEAELRSRIPRHAGMLVKVSFAK
jgi:alpha-galactosidase